MLSSSCRKYLILIFASTYIANADILGIQGPKYQGLGHAATKLISSFFTSADFESITFVMSTLNSSRLDGKDLMSSILQEIDGLRVTVRGDDRTLRKFDKSSSPMILLIDSNEAFNEVKKRLEGTRPKYTLIILLNGKFKEIEQVVKDLYKSLFYYVNFLELNGTHALLSTFFPFKKGKCQTDLSLTLINSFDLATKEWSKKVIYPDKFTNLYSCTLNVGASEKEPMVIIDKESDGQVLFDGVEVLLVKTLAKDFQFTPKFHEFNSSSGIRKAIASKKIDMGVSGSSLQTERMDYMSPTNMYISTHMVLVFPPPPYVSSLAKLYLPFDFSTWIFILAIFLIGYFVIISTKFGSPRTYNIIVGHQVSFPFTNMLIAFLGQSQKTLPSENFSRFLLAIFLIFCLVIRSCYQGILFNLLRMEIFESMPTTIDDLMAKNYTFYASESLSKRVQDFKFAKNVIVITSAENEFYRQKTLDSNFNGVVFSYEPQVLYMNYINRNSYAYLILKEKLVTNVMVFYLQANHFMSEKFNTQIDWYREFGINNYIFSVFIDTQYLRKMKAESLNKPLNLKELQAAFIIWVAGLGVSAVGLIFEILVNKTKIGYTR